MNRRPAWVVGSGLVLLVVASLVWYLQRPARQIGLPAGHTQFQPANCEFQARMAGEPEIQEQFRGELTLTSAQLKYPSGTTLRVSCTPFFVVDQAAFKAQLEQQLLFASRSAGIQDAETSITEQDEQTIASYWGLRGDGGTFVRSDTYVGDRSFMEVLVFAPAQLQRQATSTAMIEVRRP